MKKYSETVGRRGELFFETVCKNLGIPLLACTKMKPKLVLKGNKIIWQKYRTGLVDYKIGYNNIEVKTSTRMLWGYGHNWPHFDYLVCVNIVGDSFETFIIPRWELPSEKALNINRAGENYSWLQQWKDRWPLLVEGQAHVLANTG